MSFSKQLLIYIGILVTLSVISVAAIGAASARGFIPTNTNSDLRLNIDENLQNQFDFKSKCPDKGKGNKMGHWRSMASGNIESKLQAAVDAGKITQEEADAKLEFISQRQGNKMGHWRSMASGNIESKLQAAVDAGKITQEEADAKLEFIKRK